MALIDRISFPVEKIFEKGLYLLGWVLVIGFYFLMGMHLWAYFEVVAPLMHDRLGTKLGLSWSFVGLVLLYNMVFNHVFACIIKASGPSDIPKIE